MILNKNENLCPSFVMSASNVENVELKSFSEQASSMSLSSEPSTTFTYTVNKETNPRIRYIMSYYGYQ